MNNKIQTVRARRARVAMRAPLALAVAGALSLIATPEARAFEFSNGNLSGSFDTTVSYGLSVRMEDRDDDLIGKAQFDPTLAAQIAALQAQGRYLDAQALQVAARGRFSVNNDDGNLKYDDGDLFSNAVKLTSELGLNWGDSGAFVRATYFYDFENEGRDDLTEAAQEKVGSDFQLLDAFLFHNFSVGETATGSVRVGRQVVSWGESTFIQNGINVINPIDVSKLRVAGAELKEAFLPVDSLWASISLTENLSVEGVYLLEWEEIEPDASGTYFSTNDFATQGGTYVMLGFGTAPQPVNNPELFYDTCQSGPAGFARTDTGLPPALVGIGCGAAFPRAPNRNARDGGQYGLALRYFASELNETEFAFYFLKYHSRLPLISGISVTSSATSSGRYFVEYPEDIDLYGLSWNTTLPAGVAWQGEISFRPNTPLQIDDVELLFAGLSPLNALLPQPQLRFNSQLGSYGPGQYIRGWERHEVSQLQSTFTKVFGPGNFLAAQQIALVGEVGATKVWDLPDPSLLRYQGDGTDTGGGPGIDGGQLRNPITQTDGFPNQFSWGYRLAVRADYNNAFGSAFNLSPRVAFNHDVNGITPGPGGNFLEDRKSATIGVEGSYLSAWSADLSYTAFFGAGNLNLIGDRDFLSFTVKYSF
jgi:hypothetical protein